LSRQRADEQQTNEHMRNESKELAVLPPPERRVDWPAEVEKLRKRKLKNLAAGDSTDLTSRRSTTLGGAVWTHDPPQTECTG